MNGFVEEGDFLGSIVGLLDFSIVGWDGTNKNWGKIICVKFSYFSFFAFMKVLYITNKLINSQEALNWFQFYCDDTKDLIIRKSLYDAKQFMEKHLIDEQKHIDFVVTDWQFGTNNSQSILQWLRSSEKIYSDKNFKFRSIPVLLIEDTLSQSRTISAGFDQVVMDFPANPLKLRSAVKNAIKTWRYNLADDLDLIGLDPKTQKIFTNDRISFISYYKLKILSREFVDNKFKKLNYIWANPNPTVLQANDLFSEKMYKTLKNPPRYLEKEFHDFFRSNPTFIKGEDFSTTSADMLYEKHFYKNGTRKYDEPDFINKPLLYSLRSPEIFEIKRQSQRLITYQGDRFLHKAKESFKQVKRYKEYMESSDPRHQYYVQYHLGQIYNSYDYSLLMGSLDEKLEHEDLIKRLKSDFDFEDINLITYEELLQKHIRLCERLEEFNIFN